MSGSGFHPLKRGHFSGGAALTSQMPGGLDALIGNLALRRETILAPLATAQAVHAQIAGNIDSGAGITQPSTPRPLLITFSANWNGGDLVVTGYRNDGALVTETVVAPAGGGAVYTSQAFLKITNLKNMGTFGAGTIDVQTGVSLAVCACGTEIIFLQLACDHVVEAFSASSAKYGSFTPTTGPNAAHNYEVYYLIDTVGAPNPQF